MDQTLTLGLLLGGAIGNAIDRFRLGYVVDFVDGGLGTTRFFTFNLADAAISGAIFMKLGRAPTTQRMGEWPDVITKFSLLFRPLGIRTTPSRLWLTAQTRSD